MSGTGRGLTDPVCACEVVLHRYRNLTKCQDCENAEGRTLSTSTSGQEASMTRLTSEAVKAMTWADRDATTDDQRREYVRDVFGIVVADDQPVPVGVLCLGLPGDITEADREAARRFATEHGFA